MWGHEGREGARGERRRPDRGGRGPGWQSGQATAHRRRRPETSARPRVEVAPPSLMALDLLAFAAHRDDNEITCGGLLIRMAEKGYKVGACDLTQGEMGTRGSAPERKSECEEATKLMGLAAR